MCGEARRDGFGLCSIVKLLSFRFWEIQDASSRTRVWKVTPGSTNKNVAALISFQGGRSSVGRSGTAKGSSELAA